MKLCVFQGTFNPIHNAHLRAAQFIVDTFDYDKILFIPAFNPPHKDTGKEFSTHRLNMVKLAVSDSPQFLASDIEFELKGKSYTYLTILELYKRFDIEGRIKFIIGTDAFRNIESWYEAEKLKQIVDFIVFIRENNFDKKDFDRLREKGYNFELMPMEFNDISSTEIRKRIANNQSLKELVPQKVEEYIKKNELYKN